MGVEKGKRGTLHVIHLERVRLFVRRFVTFKCEKRYLNAQFNVICYKIALKL